MFSERTSGSWRRWREAVFATCTVWLVLQNLALLALFAWGAPASAWAAGSALARKALTLSGQLGMLALALAAGLALAAWLMQAPVARRSNGTRAEGR